MNLVLITILFFSIDTFANSEYDSSGRKAISGKRYELLSGIKKSPRLRIFSQSKNSNLNRFLLKSAHFIPSGSVVINLGLGDGHNSIFLATKGHRVIGIDPDPTVVKNSRFLARRFGVRLDAVVSRFEDYKIGEGVIDAIVSPQFINQDIHRRALSWLRPGGILIYENYKSENEYPLEDFYKLAGLEVLKYEKMIGRSEASIVLRKKD